MKITRKLLSYAGPIGLITLSQVVYAQTAPKAPAPAAPATAPAPAPEPATATAPATAAPAPVVLDANAPLPPPAPVAIPPAPAPIVEPAPVAAPPVAPAPKDEVLPKKLGIGNSGWLQVGGLLQGWMLVQDSTREVTSKDPTFGFRLRRAQLKFSGDIVKDRFGYFVLFDAAKAMSFSQIPASGSPTGYNPSDDRTGLLDFMVTVKSSVVDVSIGQWKSPISYEGTTSSAELLLPERAYTTRYFGDNYDSGLRADKKFDYVKYSLQMLQGAPGPNQVDKNRQKELALRLEFTPFKDKTLMVGGAALTSVGQRSTASAAAATRDIIEVDVAADVADFIARGELLWGWAGRTGDGAPDRVKSRGMAASFAYTIAKTIQPVARISYLDVDATTDGTPGARPLVAKFGVRTDEIRSYEFGVNYLIDGKFAKIQAAYGYFDMDNIDYMHQFILSGQASF